MQWLVVSRIPEQSLRYRLNADTFGRAAQMAVYQLLGLERIVPPIKAHDHAAKTQFAALLKAFA